MDATCTIQDSIHVFRLVHKYVSRILGTYHRVALFIMHRSDILFSAFTYNKREEAVDYEYYYALYKENYDHNAKYE